mgnify:CR=1 FL=1
MPGTLRELGCTGAGSAVAAAAEQNGQAAPTKDAGKSAAKKSTKKADKPLKAASTAKRTGQLGSQPTLWVRAQGDVREKARATMFKINRDLFELDAEIARLSEQIKPAADAVIAVGRRIHGGVMLQVGHKVLKVMEDKSGGQVRVIEDRITVT